MSEPWRVTELQDRISSYAERGWTMRLAANVVHGLVVHVERDRIAFLGTGVVKRLVSASRRGVGVRLSLNELKEANTKLSRP